MSDGSSYLWLGSSFFISLNFFNEGNVINMITNAKSIKEHAKKYNLRMYEVANVLGVGESTFYSTYMHSTDETKLKYVLDAIDSYVKGDAE